MKVVTIIALSLAAVIGVGVIAIFIAFILGQQPTHGRAIGAYPDPQKALFVIDVQEDFTGAAARAPFPVPDADRLIERINTISAWAKQKGYIICYIGQQLPHGLLFRMMTGNRGIIGTPGVKLDRRLNVVSGSYFPKMYADALSNKDLERFLRQQQVDQVFVCGLDAAHCVDATARGAVNHGYRVVVIEDAVATIDSKPMAGIIEGYKRRGINTISAGAFLKEN
jgi:nicotinamidase/pyrazinamidase